MQLWPIWDAWAAARGGASASDSAGSSVLPLLRINLCLITVISHRYFITNANNLPIMWLEEERGFLQCMTLSGSEKNLTFLFPSLYSVRRWGLSSFLYNYAATAVLYPPVLHVALRPRWFILQRVAHCYYLPPVHMTQAHMHKCIWQQALHQLYRVVQQKLNQAGTSWFSGQAQWSQGACVRGAPSLTGQAPRGGSSWHPASCLPCAVFGPLQAWQRLLSLFGRDKLGENRVGAAAAVSLVGSWHGHRHLPYSK